MYFAFFDMQSRGNQITKVSAFEVNDATKLVSSLNSWVDLFTNAMTGRARSRESCSFERRYHYYSRAYPSDFAIILTT